MLNPARAKRCTVASCSEPFGMPSLSVIVVDSTRRRPTHKPQGSQGLISSDCVCSALSVATRVRHTYSAAFRFIERAVETGALAGVADVAVAEPLHFQQHRIVVAVDEDVDDLELVAGGLALHPQLVARAAEEGGVAGAPRFRERDVVHEAHHQHFGAARILDHRWNQSVEFRIVHKNKNPAGWGGVLGLCTSYCLLSTASDHTAPAGPWPWWKWWRA